MLATTSADLQALPCKESMSYVTRSREAVSADRLTPPWPAIRARPRECRRCRRIDRAAPPRAARRWAAELNGVRRAHDSKAHTVVPKLLQNLACLCRAHVEEPIGQILPIEQCTTDARRQTGTEDHIDVLRSEHQLLAGPTLDDADTVFLHYGEVGLFGHRLLDRGSKLDAA